jgi:hypothetical protein
VKREAAGVQRAAGRSTGMERKAARATGVQRAAVRRRGAQGKGTAPGRGKGRGGSAILPEFCDYDCPHAAFTPPDTSGACRRDQAIWCTLLARFNNKNARCLARPGKP